MRNAGRQWNFSDLGGQGSEGGGGSQVTVSQFEIEDGTLAISDLGSEKSRALYEHVDIGLNDIAPGKPFRLLAVAQLPGSGKDSFAWRARAGRWRNGPALQRACVAEGSAGSGADEFLGSTLPLDGLLTGTADLRSTASLATATGRLELKNGSTRGKELGIPVTLDFELSDDLPAGVLQARKLKLMAQNVTIEGSGEVNTKGIERERAPARRPIPACAMCSPWRAFSAWRRLTDRGRLSLDAAVQGPLSGTSFL